MSAVDNPFSRPGVGERYDAGRPRYHHIPVQWLADKLAGKVADVLDVACGTGHSTKALAESFTRVAGCDLSPAMLETARRNAELEFFESDASSLPFSDSSFDLFTVFMGFHWFDQPKFLGEARRALRRPGYLAIDDYGFSGNMVGNPEFSAFNKDFYIANFPAPKRNKDSLSPSEMFAHGFTLEDEREYSHRLLLDADSFIRYLKTQSNLLTSKRMDEAELTEFLSKSFAPYFNGAKQELEFGGCIRLYRL